MSGPATFSDRALQSTSQALMSDSSQRIPRGPMRIGLGNAPFYNRRQMVEREMPVSAVNCLLVSSRSKRSMVTQHLRGLGYGSHWRNIDNGPRRRSWRQEKDCTRPRSPSSEGLHLRAPCSSAYLRDAPIPLSFWVSYVRQAETSTLVAPSPRSLRTNCSTAPRLQ